MQTLSFDIVNPKVISLLNNLVELRLIRPVAPAVMTDTIQTHLASEPMLAKEWLTPQEDEAWKSL
jgi:hypothetical protein